MNKQQILTFKTNVAVIVVNALNAKFKAAGTNNRAFLHSANQVEITVPAGEDVDIVDGVLDTHQGVYGTEWFQVDDTPAPILEPTPPPKKKGKVDLSKAHNYIVASNHHRDKTYAPYCGRCPGLFRMKVVEPFLWKHDCGAIHDERQVLIEG